MKKSAIFWAIAQAIVLLLLIFWNYYSNTGAVGGNTVASVSQKYSNLFVPAGYAFAIWGLIYLGLLGLAGYMLYAAFSKQHSAVFVHQTAPWLILAHFSNATWLWFWLQERTGWALLFIVGIQFFLLLVLFLIEGRPSQRTGRFELLVRQPLLLYAGWIAVATIANTASHLTAIGWEAPVFSELQWTVLALALATLLNLLMLRLRHWIAFAGVGIWSLSAIAFRHWGDIPTLQWAALAAAGILGMVLLLQVYQRRSLTRP